MQDSLKRFRDRLRVIIILYSFCEKIENDTEGYYGEFRSEIKIQALDFLLRYPDFLSIELMDLMDNDTSIYPSEIKSIIEKIYQEKEPEIRAEEMEKFFHGAYESIDDVIAFLVSVGFIEFQSKKRIDGKTYDKIYYLTQECKSKIETTLKTIPSITWYFERCELIKKYFGRYSGSELKKRQYRYSEYKDISYKSHIQSINEKVKDIFEKRFNSQLA